MKITQPVGIRAYGSYLPERALALSEIEQAHNKKPGTVSRSLKVNQKSVPDVDEDTATISTAAAHQALERAEQTAKDQKSNFSLKTVGSLFIGSESHPYAVKPTGTIVAQALGLSENLSLADLQFACKAGTQALQIVSSYVLSGFCLSGLAIGADTAQAEPGDALEYTAAAGGAAFLIGSELLLAELKATNSVATDTPDFWRKPGEEYPQHAGRFTGEPAYFYHVTASARKLLQEVDLSPEDIDYCVFHTPNGKFPRKAASKLGFSQNQLQPSLVVEKVGNTYAGASMLALAAVLDQAKAEETILVTSYGSGAGADSFLFTTTSLLPKVRKKWRDSVLDQISEMENLTYQQYQQVMKDRHH